MFNYFLVLAALIANAYIQSMQKQAAISSNVSTSIAVFEALISWVALLIHKRSRALLDTIETGLRREEDILFPNGTGFLNVDVGYRPPLARHRYQFPFTYWAFVIGFMIMAGYSSGYLQVVSDWLAQHTYCKQLWDGTNKDPGRPGVPLTARIFARLKPSSPNDAGF